jgi:hypothetical protein
MTDESPDNSVANYSETESERRVELYLIEADLERLANGGTLTLTGEQLPDFDPDGKVVTVRVQRFGS